MCVSEAVKRRGSVGRIGDSGSSRGGPDQCHVCYIGRRSAAEQQILIAFELVILLGNRSLLGSRGRVTLQLA